MNRTGAKRKLIAAFGGKAEAGRQAKQQQIENLQHQIEEYQDWLSQLPHRDACGYCVAQGSTTKVDHSPSGCHRMGQRRLEEFGKLALDLKHVAHGAPCYRCLIHSMGRNSLHPPFEQRRCEHPNFLPGLLFAIWSNPSWRAQAASEFGTTWKTISDYDHWVTHGTAGTGWPSMQLWRFWETTLKV